MLDTPVALIIFNRPHTTERVFAEIAKAKPRKLFVIADGPRTDREGEAERCAATRDVVERIDWDCDVLRNYSDVNLGCGNRPASGVSWVFEHVESAIILEDDCVPHPTFFRYCEELLEKYRDDERIMHIGSGGFQFGRQPSGYSYFFSRHFPSWGWASWRRAWGAFDMSLKLWPAVRDDSWLWDIYDDERVIDFFRTVFDQTHGAGGNMSWWDFQWTFSCWLQHGLSILPHTSLVSNIGFGNDATHTRGASDRIANVPTSAMVFPLRHPPHVVRDREADRVFVDNVVMPYIAPRPSLYGRLRTRCVAAMPAPMRRTILAARALLLNG